MIVLVATIREQIGLKRSANDEHISLLSVNNNEIVDRPFFSCSTSMVTSFVYSLASGQSG